MSNVKKLIEQKQARLNHLVQCGRIKQAYANELLESYIKFICKHFGC